MASVVQGFDAIKNIYEPCQRHLAGRKKLSDLHLWAVGLYVFMYSTEDSKDIRATDIIGQY